AVDAALAPLLADLRASPRPTLIVVTADHGEGLGDHGEQSHGLFAYESTLRVPLIIAEASGSPKSPRTQSRSFFPNLEVSASEDARGGEASTTPARHVDVLPTILNAVGLPAAHDLPGRALLTAAERADASSPLPSYFEAMSATLNRGWAPLAGVIVDREKYIDLPAAERYDLASDPMERSNVAGRSPERDRTLAATLRGFNATAPAQRQAEDAETIARLRALGYVSGGAPARVRYTEADDPK